MAKKTNWVKIRILMDLKDLKKGDIITMNKDGAEMYIKEGSAEYVEKEISDLDLSLSQTPEKFREEYLTRALLSGNYDLIEPPKKYLEILKDPKLFNKITETEFDKKIVGEIGSRKVLFLCAAGGRLVINSQVASYNILVNDEAGTGKDYVAGRVLEIIPKEYYLHKTRISPTVFTYWHNQDNEPDWTWDGKVFYPEDISEVVLNSDVFKVMCSSGSSATITIKQKAIDIEIVGKPVMITTTATANPNPELVRRFVILNLDSSENQTQAIMDRHCDYAKEGIIPEYNPDFKYSLGLMKRVKVKIPFADALKKVLPSKSVIMRTHLPRFLDYIKASAAFHQYQREIEKDFVIATGDDYNIARECFLKLCSNRYMIPLTINQKRILSAFSKNPLEKYSVTQFHAQNNIMSIPALQTNLGILARYGLLKTEIGKDSYGRDMEQYSLSESYDPNYAIDLPKYAELLKQVKQPNKPKQVKQVKQPPKKEGDVKDVKDVKADLCLNCSAPATYEIDNKAYCKACYLEEST